MNARVIIGGLVILVFLVWGASAFFQTTIQYVSLDKARSSERPVQVLGKIDFASVDYDADQTVLRFAIFDAEAVNPATAERLTVEYTGVVPGNFDQAETVVAKGTGNGEVFTADQLLVKCPSKYQGEQGEGYQDMRRHEEAQIQGEA